jgi:diguanylate cyclase (GGDEF)-like protein
MGAFTWAEAGRAGRDPSDDPSGRRRAVLLGVLLAGAALVVLAGVPSAWPLLALPVALAAPLAGPRGLVTALAVTGVVLALVSGGAGADGTALAVGFVTFALAGVAVGAGHLVKDREARHVAMLSLTDRLTGLGNYAYFADALPRECRRAARYGQPLSLVLLDVDRFKAFNDRHGHDAGNRLLAAVGVAILGATRTSDIAVRYGGEEFAVIVPGPAAEAMAVAERVRCAVGELRLPVAGGEEIGTTISAGVSEFVGTDGDGERLIDRADKALYGSKSAGRDRVSLFTPEHRWAAA